MACRFSQFSRSSISSSKCRFAAFFSDLLRGLLLESAPRAGFAGLLFFLGLLLLFCGNSTGLVGTLSNTGLRFWKVLCFLCLGCGYIVVVSVDGNSNVVLFSEGFETL